MENIFTEKLQSVVQKLLEHQQQICTAESCTGGLISSVLTELPGSSQWFERGFVTYSNAAKEELLGVDPQMIKTHGAVSEAVALAMAKGALANSYATIAVSITGIAGPDGGTEAKPVGTVCIGWCNKQRHEAATFHLLGDRQQIRHQTCQIVLEKLEQYLNF